MPTETNPRERVEALMREKNLSIGSRVKVVLDPPYEDITEWTGRITSLHGGVHLSYAGDNKLAIPWNDIQEMEAA